MSSRLIWKGRVMNKPINKLLQLVLGLSCLLSTQVWAGFDEEYDAKPWDEIAVQLPPFPKDQDLYSFYVSATATSRFFLDSQNLMIGSDGVVRYTLVVISPSGVRNVSFEGMRCETRERRIYASGHADGSWSKARGNRWVRIQEATTNRQHAALFTDFLCPGGVIVYRVDEIQRPLLKDGQPLSGKP